MDSTIEAASSLVPIFPGEEISEDVNGILPLLQRLDKLIQQAVSALASPEEELKPTWLEPTRTSPPEKSSLHIREDSPLAWLQKTFRLSAFDLDLLAIALAPELDRQIAWFYGYLQDNLAQKRPTVDLALNLLGVATLKEKLSFRQHFSTTSPLIAHRLLHLDADSPSQTATLLEHSLILDRQVVRFLLQQPGLDLRLIPCCQLVPPNNFYHTIYTNLDLQPKLAALLSENSIAKQPLLLYFSKCDRLSKRHTAENLAKTLKVSLLVADLGKMLEDKAKFEEKLQLVLREAWFFHRLLYLDNFDLLFLPENQTLHQTCLTALAQNQTITILGGEAPWKPHAIGDKALITIPFTIPEANQRKVAWQNHLQAAQISLEEHELNLLSDRFCLTPDRIAATVATARNNIYWQSIKTDSVANTKESSQQYDTQRSTHLFSNLCNAARTQTTLDLGALAYRIEPKYTWDDIILHPNRLKQLKDLCKEFEYRDLVHRQWGFDAKLSLGKGLNVLFSGASGTGKTMAAEVIANQLQLDLYKIDLSQIISKYIGETEKNLNRIFTAASNSNAILLFDEADALFGKRSEVQDARDRYANIEVGYLLQKMEEYRGIAILTTNLRDNIDKAFERRLRFIVKFHPPDTENRYLIWQKVFPKNAPCDILDIEFLAQNFELSGASIRNIALTAAFLAADDGGVIEMIHIIRSIQREYQKTGQILRDRELGQYANHI